MPDRSASQSSDDHDRSQSTHSSSDRDGAHTSPSPSHSTSSPRRRFLTVAAGSTVLSATAGCVDTDSDDSSASSRVDPHHEEAETVDDLPLFDAHTHLTPMAARGHDALSADALVDWMDENGVDTAAVHALESPEAYPVPATSWWLLEEVQPHADRLVPFVTIDPRTLIHDRDIVEDVLEQYLDRGARGFGELKAGIGIDDELARQAYELCSTYDLPVTFHTDGQSMTDDIGLPGLESVLQSFPDVDFLAHAHGWWIHVSGDVTTMDRGRAHEGAVAPGGRVPELLGTYDNLYGDLSAAAGWNALTRDEAFGQSFLEDHHDSLVFGTDYLYPGQQVDHFDLFERFDLSLEAWADVRYRNFQSLLG